MHKNEVGNNYLHVHKRLIQSATIVKEVWSIITGTGNKIYRFVTDHSNVLHSEADRKAL